ncbi:hypothetical protein ILYODFUR_036171 [Ilyodon furcidens]|uniref:Uncharacterized protein n=1 Tax=Ilyodon furcidens TaxID=33524 RepID=A0ABV0SS02_9TELE
MKNTILVYCQDLLIKQKPELEALASMVVQWLALLLCSKKVLSLNPGLGSTWRKGNRLEGFGFDIQVFFGEVIDPEDVKLICSTIFQIEYTTIISLQMHLSKCFCFHHDAFKFHLKTAGRY